jgi:hypothetical protein
MKPYSFLLCFGYAENGKLGFVPFVSNEKFASPKEAFVNLANFFKDAFMSKGFAPHKACCKKSKKLNPDSDFCGKCRSPLDNAAFDSEAFENFVEQISISDNNSYNEDIIDWDTSLWVPELPEDLNSAKVIYHAEKVLTAAIGDEHSYDKRVTIDSIFKDQDETNFFSYWG